MLTLRQDAMHISTLWAAVNEYLGRYRRDKQDFVLLQSLTFLGSLKNNHGPLTQRLLEDQPDFSTAADPPCADLSARLWSAASELAPRVLQRRELFGIDRSTDNAGIPLFFWTVRERHEAITRLLLELCGITVLEDEFPSWCSLSVATRTGHLKAVVLHLSDRGPNDSFPAQAQNLLYEAIGGGHVFIVDELLQAGARPDEKAVHHAIRIGHEGIFDKLLQVAADANKSDPLRESDDEKDKVMFHRLLQAGTDANKCLRFAVCSGNVVFLKKFLPGCSSATINTVLWDAVAAEHETIVSTLLQSGARVTPDIWTRALTTKHWTIIGLLLEAGANPDGSYAWEVAMENKNEELVDRLLRAGANFKKYSPVEAAVRFGWGAIIDKLLEAGAKVEKGNTLWSAVRHGDESMVDKLLKAGALVNEYALLAAVEQDQEGILDRFLSAGGKATARVLRKAVELGKSSMVDRLIRSGVDVNTPDISLSPLVLAVSTKDEAMVLQLLKAGASFGKPNDSSDLSIFIHTSSQWDLGFVDNVLQKFTKAKGKGPGTKD